MKLLGYEDMIVGILLGIIMIGVSGKYYTLRFNDILLMIFLFLFLVVSVLDIINEVSTLEEGLLWTIFAVIWNAVEIMLVVGYISEKFEFGFKMVTLVPFIGIIGMTGVGLFFMLGNIMWMYFYFKA